jgi:prephenate dehydrogenase
MNAFKSEMPDDLRAVVFGGGAGWGRRVVDALAPQASAVRVIEKDADPAATIAAVAAANLVFVAIPDAEIANLLRALRAHLGRGAMLIDCASNKSGFAGLLEEIAAAGVSVCSTHPMVVSTSALRGHNVLVMPVGAAAEAATQAAGAIYGALGMTLQSFEFARHTDAMVIVQMIPHLAQRMLIQALAHGLADAGMTIADIERIAPANYLLAELGLGRVAAQRPDVSAGVIATALAQASGRRLVADLRTMIERIADSGTRREDLARLVADSVAALDPDAGWRRAMQARTEAALIRLGNLRSRHFVVVAPDRRGILRDILSVLIDAHNIDMTALDSQVVVDEHGIALARFEIGITDEEVDFARLARELGALGARVRGGENG